MRIRPRLERLRFQPFSRFNIYRYEPGDILIIVVLFQPFSRFNEGCVADVVREGFGDAGFNPSRDST